MRSCLFLVLLVLWTGLSTQAAAPPNILLVLADDLGWGDPHCYNPASRIPTPNLDRLAEDGIRFTDAHSPSAVCSPTRYALLTGRYAWRTRLQSGVLWGYSPPLIDPQRPTLASLLRKQGYRTTCIGKWHLGLGYPTRERADFGDTIEPKAQPDLIDYSRPFTAGPLAAGFEECFVIPASLDMAPYFFLRNDRVVAAPTAILEGSQHQRQGGSGFWRTGPAAPGFQPRDCLPRLIEEAEGFLRHQGPQQPFLLYLALSAPHDPWVPVAEQRGHSMAGDYGDFVTQVDHHLGRLLRVLDERGCTRNTLVIVTSDNGAHWTPADIRKYGHHANADWRGMKADLFEGGHRVPFLARWPTRIKPGTTSDALIGLQDVFATVAELCDAKVPANAGEDSVSFRRALLGRKPGSHPPLVHHSINGSFAIRDSEWKLLLAPDSGGWSTPQPGSDTARDLPALQLYHLRNDPAETGNLADARPEVVARLTRELEQIVRAGRSTPGPAATNDVPIRLRKSTTP